MSTIAAATHTIVRGLAQCQVGLWTTASTPTPTPTSNNSALNGSGSRCVAGSRDSSNTREPNTSATTANGTLIQNAQRQPPTSTMIDPSEGPAADASPPKVASTP